MKNILLIGTMIFAICLLIACNNSSQTEYESASQTQATGIEMGKTDNNSSFCYATPAIGNLYLGVSLSEFTQQKNLFLKNTPSLGGLRIVDITPVVYSDKVEIIIIRSETYLKPENGKWNSLYSDKYGYGNNYSDWLHDGKEYNIEDRLMYSFISIPNGFIAKTDGGKIYNDRGYSLNDIELWNKNSEHSLTHAYVSRIVISNYGLIERINKEVERKKQEEYNNSMSVI